MTLPTDRQTANLTPNARAVLERRYLLKDDAGAPIELVTAQRAREIEPQLTDSVKAASYCAVDGYANASLTGLYYRELLAEAGVHVYEGERVEGLDRDRTAG